MKLEQKASLPALLIVLTIYIGSRAISYGQDNIEKELNAAGTLILRVVIIFDPPSNQQGPPQNIRLDSTCMNMTRTANAGVHPMISSGYNIYCIPSLPLGQPFPTPEEIVGNPNNLVGSIPSSSTVFEDQIAVSNCEENFCYSLTSFYENGAQSGGSTIVCTPSDSEGSPDSPMIKNPVFTKGTIFIDAGGSFIASQGALLIINDADSFPLVLDATGVLFTVPKEAPGSGGRKIKKVIKKGRTVRLVVKNPDGKTSRAVLFTRN